MAYFSSLEVVLAISHSYVILPKLFLITFHSSLYFVSIRKWGRSISRTILVYLYLVPCFDNIYISLKFIIHSIYVVPICMIMYFKLSFLEEIKYIYLSIYHQMLVFITEPSRLDSVMLLGSQP